MVRAVTVLLLIAAVSVVAGCTTPHRTGTETANVSRGIGAAHVATTRAARGNESARDMVARITAKEDAIVKAQLDAALAQQAEDLRAALAAEEQAKLDTVTVQATFDKVTDDLAAQKKLTKQAFEARDVWASRARKLMLAVAALAAWIAYQALCFLPLAWRLGAAAAAGTLAFSVLYLIL